MISRTASLREGLFPVNYVEPLPQQEPNRQMVVNELTNSENTYYNDLLEVWNKFHEPMLESGLLTQDQLDAIFLNWTDLMNCSYSLLMALKVRKEGGTDAIGDIMLQHLPQLTCYVRFCGRQSAATQLLTQRINSVPELAQLVRHCEQQTSSGKLMGLIQYFVKPMQRITRYPLLIEKLLKATPESHPDRGSLQEALDEAKKLCQTVNESVRETENSGRLEWCQEHVICEGLSEKLVFNSQTNCLGQRRLVHWGTLFKHKGGKELVVFLFNDFLLLTVPVFNTQGRPFVFPSLALDGNAASASEDDQLANSQKQKYRMYKRPIILNDLMTVPEPDRDSGAEPPLLCIRVLPNEDWVFRCQSAQDRDRWKDRLTKTAKEYHNATAHFMLFVHSLL
uniref:DH domain-containing protein n=1 Tax=Macrostomum lignano TaxID=282301 RepID=A0A1I8IQW8_9PLAT